MTATTATPATRMFSLDSLEPKTWVHTLEQMILRGEIDDFEVLYSVVWDVLFRVFLNVEVATIRQLPDGLSDLAETTARVIWDGTYYKASRR